MIKKAIQAFLNAYGYRVVRNDLDARSFRKSLLAQEFRTIVDVGAAGGSTVQAWAEEFPMAHIHAVEPLPDAYRSLGVVAEKYPGRVTLWNCAAGSEDGAVEMRIHVDHTTSSSILKRTEYSTKILPDTCNELPTIVDVRRLDSLLVKNGMPLERPMLLKLDVQGYEDKVLQGARMLLEQTDYVLSEIGLAPVYSGQCDFAKFHSLLSEGGFVMAGFLEQFHLNDGTPVYADVVYRRTSAL